MGGFNKFFNSGIRAGLLLTAVSISATAFAQTAPVVRNDYVKAGEVIPPQVAQQGTTALRPSASSLPTTASADAPSKPKTLGDKYLDYIGKLEQKLVLIRQDGQKLREMAASLSGATAEGFKVDAKNLLQEIQATRNDIAGKGGVLEQARANRKATLEALAATKEAGEKRKLPPAIVSQTVQMYEDLAQEWQVVIDRSESVILTIDALVANGEATVWHMSHALLVNKHREVIAVMIAYLDSVEVFLDEVNGKLKPAALLTS